MNYPSLTGALAALFIAIIIFLTCREIFCWYWKINKSVDLMEKILAELKRSNEKPLNEK